MTFKEIDFIFPFIVFGYGAFITFVLSAPLFERIAQERLPADMWQDFQSKRPLALICLIIGGLWSLQNLWL